MGIGAVSEGDTIADRARAGMQTLAFAYGDKQAVIDEAAAYGQALSKEANHGYVFHTADQMPENWICRYYMTWNNAKGQFFGISVAADLLRLEVSLEQFHRKNNRYPSTLKELTPRYLVSIPKTVFNSNGSFVYRSVPGGSYLLYSFGPDMKDHGGDPGNRIDERGHDIVAGHIPPIDFMPFVFATVSKPPNPAVMGVGAPL
jgi:hypothetical protein